MECLAFLDQQSIFGQIHNGFEHFLRQIASGSRQEIEFFSHLGTRFWTFVILASRNFRILESIVVNFRQ